MPSLNLEASPSFHQREPKHIHEQTFGCEKKHRGEGENSPRQASQLDNIMEKDEESNLRKQGTEVKHENS